MLTCGSIVPLPLSDNDAAQLYDSGEAATFDVDYVGDDSHPHARELRPPHFALTIDPLLAAGVLATVQRRMQLAQTLTATMTKLNMYTVGGHFEMYQE